MDNSNIDQVLVNNLTTDDPNVALSAAQGKVLNDMFNYDVSSYHGVGKRNKSVVIAINPITNLLALMYTDTTEHVYYFKLTPYTP